MLKSGDFKVLNMAERTRNKPEWQVKIAKERIDILFAEAAKISDKTLQKRYVELARKIGMRYNVKIATVYRRKFCRHCHGYFGTKTKRRMNEGVLVVTCADCGKISRFPYK